MLSLDDLLHPIPPARFFADHHDRAPLHIPATADGRKQDLLTWEAFNQLLNQATLWTPRTLRILRDHTPIPPDQYCRMMHTMDGSVLRPSPRKVEVFLSAGSSVVANDVLYLHPPINALGEMLGQTFAAQVGANIYCSFKGVRAFRTHFDNHHVFVIQTRGEKVWNVYANRAENPVDNPPDNPGILRWFEQTRGPVAMQVRMKPGDVLYLPRGTYHDALTEDGESLHVTLSVNPLHERNLLGLIDNLISKDPAFGAYLPPATQDGGEALRLRLADWGRRIAAVAESQAFFEEAAVGQRRIQPFAADYTLPTRKPVTLFRTTGRAFPEAGRLIRQTYDWAVAEQRFALEDMVAQFDTLAPAEVVAALEAAEQSGAVIRD